MAGSDQAPANSNASNGLAIGNAALPPEGAKAIPYTLDFSVNSGYQIDIQRLTQNGNVTLIQSIFIDNSLNNAPLLVNPQSTNQKIICPANAQGYFPLLSLASGFINISTSGTALVFVDLLNVPVPANVWYPNAPSNQPFVFQNTGALNTFDTGLNQLVNDAPAAGQPAMNVNIIGDIAGGGGGGGLSGASYFNSYNISAANLNYANLGTGAPAGTTKFTLQGLKLLVYPDTFIAPAAAHTSFTFNWAGAGAPTFLTADVWAPGAASANALPVVLFEASELELELPIASGSFNLQLGGGWAGSGGILQVSGTFA